MVWGESIGLPSPGEGRDSVLDQIGGHPEIRDVQQQISIMLKDVEKLQPQYGVETDSTDNDGQLHHIQVSERRRKIFEHPVVEFISRLAKHKRNTLSLRRSGGLFGRFGFGCQ